MFRRAVVKVLPKRGGGHDHPDWPFQGFYKHKRIISQLDSNLWVYDGLNPEYLVDIQAPQYTLGHIVSRNLLLAWIIPMIIGWLCATYFYSFLKRPFMVSYITDDNDPVRSFLKKMKHENIIGNFKHPLGHSHSYIDEGWDPNPKGFIINRYKL